MYQRCGGGVINIFSITLLAHLRSVASQQTCPCIRRNIYACGCQENCDEEEDRGSRKEVGCQSAGYRGLRTDTDETRRGRPRVCPDKPRIQPTLQEGNSAKRDVDSAIAPTLTTATRSAADFNLQLLEMARSNANSVFDFAHRLMGMQSPSELLDVSATHARKQFESFNAQTRQMAMLAQEGWAGAAAPFTTGVASAFARVARSDEPD
jgi:hypothetical protein